MGQDWQILQFSNPLTAITLAYMQKKHTRYLSWNKDPKINPRIFYFQPCGRTRGPSPPRMLFLYLVKQSKKLQFSWVTLNASIVTRVKYINVYGKKFWYTSNLFNPWKSDTLLGRMTSDYGSIYQRISAPDGQFPKFRKGVATNFYSEFGHAQDSNRPEVNISLSHVCEETQTV